MIKSKRKINKRNLIQSSLAYGVYGNYPWRFYEFGYTLFVVDPAKPHIGAGFMNVHGTTITELKRWWGRENPNYYGRRVMDEDATLITAQ